MARAFISFTSTKLPIAIPSFAVTLLPQPKICEPPTMSLQLLLPITVVDVPEIILPLPITCEPPPNKQLFNPITVAHPALPCNFDLLPITTDNPPLVESIQEPSPITTELLPLPVLHILAFKPIATLELVEQVNAPCPIAIPEHLAYPPDGEITIPESLNAPPPIAIELVFIASALLPIAIVLVPHESAQLPNAIEVHHVQLIFHRLLLMM